MQEKLSKKVYFSGQLSNMKKFFCFLKKYCISFKLVLKYKKVEGKTIKFLFELSIYKLRFKICVQKSILFWTPDKAYEIKILSLK